jgi:hypothetical protein
VRSERGGGEERGEQRTDHDDLGAVRTAPQWVPVQPLSAYSRASQLALNRIVLIPLGSCFRRRGLCRPPCAAAVRAARGHWSRR